MCDCSIHRLDWDISDAPWDLSAPGWDDPNKNPHCLQKFSGKRKFKNERIEFTRILPEDWPRVQYERRTGELKTVIHWGQRKLLMSEIEFLNLYPRSRELHVVYAGAAPGTHTAYLSSLFPNITFHLVDPAPFTVKPTPKIRLYQGFFTHTLAHQFRNDYGGKILFVSDIRTADSEIQEEKEVDESVRSDMQMQMEWHMIMRPLRSMLKFRLPWTNGTTRYLAGEIYLPVWGPITTTETRLITHENSLEVVEYDNKKYEEQMFYFNTRVRPNMFPHGYHGQGIDHCYDCASEGYILCSYLLKQHNYKIEEAFAEFPNMSRKISVMIDRNRTLASPNLDPAKRKEHIRRRQWKDGRPAYSHAAKN